MRAVVMKRTGGPEVLEACEVPDPVRGEGEVLVAVRACALNHLDLWTRKGEGGKAAPLPHILGCDISGEILESPISALPPGQRVVLSPGTSCGRCRFCLSGEDSSCREYRILGHGRPGGYAERVSAPAANVIPIPDSLSFVEAAAFPLVFLTAWRMLRTRARLARGEDVLVWAAGSGVGMAAIQVAKHLGARVIATAGTEEKRHRALHLGAREVLDHRNDDVVAEVRRLTQKKGVDVVFEHVGEATWERSILCLAHGGRLVTCGATTGPSATTNLQHLFAKQLSLLGSYMGSKADLLEVAPLVFSGALRAVVHSTFPLVEARRAHEVLAASEHFGKLVLTVP